MVSTLLFAITLIIVIVLLTILYFKYNKLRKYFKNYNSNPVYGPGKYNYGREDPYKIQKEMRKEECLENIRKILTFKWTWYWTTKEYKKCKKIKKDFNKKFTESIKNKKNVRRK
jgi:hypothetical protein